MQSFWQKHIALYWKKTMLQMSRPFRPEEFKPRGKRKLKKKEKAGREMIVLKAI